MTALTKDENSRFYRRLARLALPMIGQELLNALINITDTFMVSRLGLRQITAVGLGNQLFFLYVLAVFGVTSGGSILMGQFYGAKDNRGVRRTLGLVLGLCLCAAALFTSVAIIAPDKFLAIYSANPGVIGEGVSYLRVVGISYVFYAVVVPMNLAQKSMSQPKIPMITTLVALLLNITLNYIFIYVNGWGVAGCAWATVIARGGELSAQLLLLRAERMPLLSHFKDYLSSNKEFFVKFLKIALPVVVNEVFWAVGTSLYNVAYKACGTEAQGAVQITSSIQLLFQTVGIGTGAAACAIISNTLGAGERDKAVAYSRRLLAASTGLAAVMSLFLLLFFGRIAGLFNVAEDVKALASSIVRMICVIMVLKTFNYTTVVGILRSGGDTLFCVLADTLTVWLCGLPAALAGGYLFHLPIYAVVGLAGLEDLTKVFITGWRVMNNKWARTLV
ncbi:MAG: MATE family efflux transporter [Clostridiales bacterium]|jgi:putative MATE family efflux protein|nr:MATE family efflux transporter [Clostridiales bacterium]